MKLIRLLNFAHCVKRIIYASGYYGLHARKRDLEGVAVLCYHGIRDRKSNEDSIPNSFLHIPEDEFESQMRFISRAFNLISFDGFLKSLHGESRLAPGSVLITFDDGYKSIYRLAKPILQKYSIKPVIFITTDYIGKKGIWPDVVFSYFKKMHYSNLETLSGYPFKHVVFTSEVEKTSVIYDIIQWMKRIESSQRIAIINEILAKDDFSIALLPKECSFLDEAEILELSNAGFDFGSHSCSHPILSKMTEEEQSKEIGKSQEVLEDILKKSIHTFAYPNGGSQDFDDNTVRILKEKDYLAAFTTIEGYHYPNSDPYRLKRFFILGNLPIYEFCHRMTVSWPSKFKS